MKGLRQRLLITGASGIIGTALRKHLRDRYDFRLLFHLEAEPARPGDEVVVGDVSSFEVMLEATAGVDAIIHLARMRDRPKMTRAAWAQQTLSTDIPGIYNVFEAARLNGVGTVVFASTNHVTGLNEEDGICSRPDEPVRPDGIYGASKAFGEALGRYYADRQGVRVFCLRIANCNARDAPHRPFAPGKSRWVSQRDLAQLVWRCIESDLRFGIFYGVSGGAEDKWDLSNARELLGYEPQDDGTLERWSLGALAGRSRGRSAPASTLTGEGMASRSGKPKIGIIGCGGIARISHAPSLQRLEAQGACEVIACADVVAESAQSLAQQFSIPRIFTDFHDLLALDELDGVTVATPPFVHKEATIAALRAGKHVLCEKPMAMNVAEAKEMLTVARETGNILTIGQGERFTAGAQAIHERIAAGDLGQIYYAKATALRKRGVPARGVFTVKKLNGGGPLIDIGVHALDLAVWLMGNPTPTGVFGATYDALAHREGVPQQNRASWGPFDPARYDVEDLCAGLIRFANGASLYLETSWLLNQAEDEVRRTDLYGTAGSATTNPCRILVDRGPAGLQDVTPDVSQGRAGNSGNFLRFERFLECIDGRAEPLVKPEESLNIQRIIDGLYRSAETGKMVEITE